MMRSAIFAVFVALTIFQQNVRAGCADGTTRQKAAKSCSAIFYCYPSSSSGYYYVLGTHGPTRVYCHMDARCGVTGGWMRVTSLNMKFGSSCPSHFRLEYSGGKRLCVKRVSTGCSSQYYSTGGVPYAEVCGKAIGYAYGSPDAAPFPVGTYRSIEEAYTWTAYRLLMDQHLASTSGLILEDSQTIILINTFITAPVLLRGYPFLITTLLAITSIVSLETLTDIG